MDLASFSRRGGQARSARKTQANRAKAIAFWREVRAGKRSAPQHLPRGNDLKELGRKLAPICRRHGIMRLEIFGSRARGDNGPRSDIDLIATFQKNPGLKFFPLEEEMGRCAGAPVHLLSVTSLRGLTNPYRRRSILKDRRVLFHAGA